MQCQPIGLRHITRNKVYAPVHEVCYECDIPRQPVQFSNYQCGAVQFASRKRRNQFRAMCLCTRLYLNMFSYDRMASG